MNSTETPGGSGIPAGWYDDPSGQGLRWWDGVRWTEHVHTAESAAAAAGEADAGEREAPPPQLVKLRQSIQARGAKGVGMVLGGLVLIVVVIALLVSGGSDESGNAATPHSAAPGRNVVVRREIKVLHKQLQNKKLPKAQTKALKRELKKLEAELTGGSSSKKGMAGNSGNGGKSSKQTKTPGEEGN